MLGSDVAWLGSGVTGASLLGSDVTGASLLGSEVTGTTSLSLLGTVVSRDGILHRSSSSTNLVDARTTTSTVGISIWFIITPDLSYGLFSNRLFTLSGGLLSSNKLSLILFYHDECTTKT